MINAHPAHCVYLHQNVLACNVAILLLIGYKFSVDNMFLLGFLVLVFIKMIVKINDELY